MISKGKHSWEQCWGGALMDRVQSTTVSDLLLWISTSSGPAPQDTFWAWIGFCSPLTLPPPSIPQYESSRTFCTIQSGQSYRETNFIVVSVTKMLTDSKVLLCYRSKGNQTHPSPDPELPGIFMQLCPAQLHSVPFTLYSVYAVSPRVLGFTISMAECRVPAPTPPNGKWVHNVKTSDLNFNEYLVKHWLNWHSVLTLYFQLELPCNLLAGQVFNDRDPASLWSRVTMAAAPFW